MDASSSSSSSCDQSDAGLGRALAAVPSELVARMVAWNKQFYEDTHEADEGQRCEWSPWPSNDGRGTYHVTYAQREAAMRWTLRERREIVDDLLDALLDSADAYDESVPVDVAAFMRKPNLNKAHVRPWSP